MSKLQWHNERRRVGSLIKWPINPRRISEEQTNNLKASLEKFNLADPIIIDVDNTIVGGHQRLTVLKLLGRQDEEIDVRVPSRKLTDDEFRELALRLNINTGEWDWDVLAEHFDADELVSLGFETDDLIEHEMIDDPASSEGNDIDAGARISEADELQAQWETQVGQLWQLGYHRLLCGDSTSAADVERLLGDTIPQLMITDPPYGVEYDPHWRDEAGLAHNKRDGVMNDDRADWTDAWLLFPGPVAYVWHAGLYASTVQSSLENAGFEVRSQIIWSKTRFVIGRGNYHWQHEPCWYAVRKGETARWNGSRGESTVWEISSRDQDTDTAHGTQKPIECMERPILNNTLRGQAVYDPFCGSGTTIIAAERSGRTCYAMELDPKYVAVILQRYADATGDEPILVEGHE